MRQITPVLSEAAQWVGPRLIGGDFNTNYLRWTGNVLPIGLSSQSHAIEKAMSANGFTTPPAGSRPTSRFLGLRLDWFYTHDLCVFDTAIEPIKFSDHHAVRMTVAPYTSLTEAHASR